MRMQGNCAVFIDEIEGTHVNVTVQHLVRLTPISVFKVSICLRVAKKSKDKVLHTSSNFTFGDKMRVGMHICHETGKKQREKRNVFEKRQTYYLVSCGVNSPPQPRAN